MELFLFALAALLAEVLGTVGGFGSSLFFVPLAGFFMDFDSVLGITALFHLSSNVSKIALFRQGIDRCILLKMGLPAVVCVIAGAYLSRFADTHLLEIALGGFLIALSALFLAFEQLALRPTTPNAIASGALSGLLAGLLGTGGAIRGIALAAFSLPKEVFIATSAAIDLGVDASRSVVYITNGYVHRHDLYLIPVLFVVSFVGTLLGKKLLGYVSETQFKRIVLLLILCVGIITLWNALRR